MPEKDKVLYGVSNLHFGEYEVSATGEVTLGTPFHLPGTTSIELEPESDDNKTYADNVVYYSNYSNNGKSGTITNMLFSDEFKTRFLNYITLADGGVAEVKGMQSAPCYIMFQAEGDKLGRRFIAYNVALGQISRNYETTEDSIEPATGELPITINGDNGTGIIMVSYEKGNAAYNSLFSTPPVPALPSESE